eukprot:scaffold203233_cov21-Tisochrysis_lutea.AAC.6
MSASCINQAHKPASCTSVHACVMHQSSAHDYACTHLHCRLTCRPPARPLSLLAPPHCPRALETARSGKITAQLQAE